MYQDIPTIDKTKYINKREPAGLTDSEVNVVLVAFYVVIFVLMVST